jgi:two-component system, cell cycle sensor histidine kinase and response regulator CckA
MALHLRLKMYMTAETTKSQHDRRIIFIVDDDPLILSCVSEILAGNDYDVRTYKSGGEALRQSKDFKGEIHLLLSDFQMPGMSGVELATEMTSVRPQLKVLLMSGFPEGMLVLNQGWHFLAKPFIGSQLRALVAGLANPDKPSRYLA